MNPSPRWANERLEADRLLAIANFRSERLEEPLGDYLDAFDAYREHVERLLKATANLRNLDEQPLAVLSDPSLLEVFRYLAAPPISEADLRVLAEARSLAPGRLARQPEAVERLVATVRQVLDRRRFVWVIEGRDPTEIERAAAVAASAALIAASRVQTARRNTGKARQEAMVAEALEAAGLIGVVRRDIPTLGYAPNPGEFCGESRLGTRKADLVIRLWDQRLMPIECKVSNSSLNSVKRLNNDAAVKAAVWLHDFGARQVVPAAVLSGVYNLRNLVEAQDRGLALFWAHDPAALTDWIASTAAR